MNNHKIVFRWEYFSSSVVIGVIAYSHSSLYQYNTTNREASLLHFNLNLFELNAMKKTYGIGWLTNRASQPPPEPEDRKGAKTYRQATTG